MVFTAAKEAPAPLVEVGRSYFISSGSMGVKGKIIGEIGGGWYRVAPVNLSTKEEIAVNVGQAFWLQPTRD